MGEPKSRRSTDESPATSSSSTPISTTAPPPPPLPPKARLNQPSSLVNPPKKKNKPKVLRVFRSVFRSFPIMTPVCNFSAAVPVGLNPETHRHVSGNRITGTLFGYRKGRISLSIQESPRCIPTLIIELAIQTNLLLKELNSGMVRVALECEKQTDKEKTRLLEEPLWTMYCNGKKTGYAVKRDPTGEDLNVMELLSAISMGAGVLPGALESEGPEGELAYMRAHFDRVVGSKDSETFYMLGLGPEGVNGPELSVFFVRV